jgi:hypothetical protein
LPVALPLVIERSDDLVDPELNTKEDTVECLLTQDFHDMVLEHYPLLASLGFRGGPSRLSLLLLNPSESNVFLSSFDGLVELLVRFEIIAEQVHQETSLLLIWT